MLPSNSLFRSGTTTAFLLPFLALFMLTFCSKKSDQPDKDTEALYYNVELHLDGQRSEELGVPSDSYYTPSGELFSGVQKGYHSDSDSLYMKQHFEDGINTRSVFYMEDGNVNELIHTRYLDEHISKEIYHNGDLNYQNVPPTESEDGMGHLRTWHKNGQLSFEVNYTGDQVYQGLATEYDEEGNITKQERYEDGEVVETIK